MSNAPRCDDCGRFMTRKGATWANIYDLTGRCLDREHFRCARCTGKLGPVQSNAEPYDGNMQHYQGHFA